MKFCSQCGALVSRSTPAGDTHERFVCDACQTIHYQNPKMVVGCIPEWEDQILLCRRAIEPRLGLWTLPAGFMELSETTAQAAARGGHGRSQCFHRNRRPAYALQSAAHQPGLPYLSRPAAQPRRRARRRKPEVRLFREAEVPWEQIAFPAVTYALQHYFADRRLGRYTLHHGEHNAPQR